MCAISKRLYSHMCWCKSCGIFSEWAHQREIEAQILGWGYRV